MVLCKEDPVLALWALRNSLEAMRHEFEYLLGCKTARIEPDPVLAGRISRLRDGLVWFGLRGSGPSCPVSVLEIRGTGPDR